MKQWVRLPPTDETTCAAYLNEARSFVRTHTTPTRVTARNPVSARSVREDRS